MFLEPFMDKLEFHSDRLNDTLRDVVDRLSALSYGVRGEVARDEFVMRGGQATVEAAKTDCVVNLRPSEGFCWLTNLLAFTGAETGNVLVYISTIHPQNLVGNFSTSSSVSFDEVYVPFGAELVCHFIEQTAGQICTANVQAKEWGKPGDPIPVRDGREASYDHPNQVIPQARSGHPLVNVE